MMQITTITPARYPISVKAGISECSAAYAKIVQKLCSISGKEQLQLPDWHLSENSITPASSSAYSDITRDDCDIRLGFWQGVTEGGHKLTLHCFNNELAVFEVVLKPEQDIPQKELKDWSGRETTKAIAEFSKKEFADIYNALRSAHIDNLVVGGETPGIFPLWVGSILQITPAEIEKTENQELLHEWLDATIRPKDAQDIIRGELQHSLRWLNYVIVDNQDRSGRLKVEAMIVAQYFYAVQYHINRNLLADISDVFLEKNIRSCEAKLQRVRARAQLHITTYYEARNYFVRAKKQWIEEILQAWDFDGLLNNANRMIDVCSTRIDEINVRKRSQATVLTDGLLAIIGLFTILDLALQFIGYSREVVTSPTLNYIDEDTSILFREIAAWNIDYVMAINLIIVLLLGVVYILLKKR